MVIAEKEIHFNHSRQQRATFCGLFPRGMESTRKNARLAAGAGLSLRGLAPQVMEPPNLAKFVKQTGRLYRLYLENTADTLGVLQNINPNAHKAEWIAACETHETNKRKHWEAYLDGLATAFERELQETQS